MTPDLVWIMIIANAVIAAVTIVNTWMLAWYDKKRRKKQKPQKAENEEVQPRRRGARRGFLIAIMFVLSIFTLILLTLLPHPNTNIQIFQVAYSVGFVVLAIVLSLISPLVEITHKQSDATSRLIDMTTAIVQSLPKKSPNPTVDTDAHDKGARGSP